MKGASDKNLSLWLGVAFVLLSVAAGAGWLYGIDVSLMSAAQAYTWGFFDAASRFFSTLGSWMITGGLLLVLVAVLLAADGGSPDDYSSRFWRPGCWSCY